MTRSSQVGANRNWNTSLALERSQLQLEPELFRARARLQAESQFASAEDKSTVAEKLRDPLTWLQHHTRTHNPHWKQEGADSPYKPFPDKPYFRPIIDRFQSEPITLVAKARDLMLSWLAVGFLTHSCLTTPGLEVLLQSQTEGKAAELIQYAKYLYDFSDDDIKAAHPLTVPLGRQNDLELSFAHNSRLVGIPHGASKIRSYHPFALLLDEAAFIADAGECFNEAVACCQKIIVVSTAGPGWFESVCVSAE
jgi:hypothetical protein